MTSPDLTPIGIKLEGIGHLLRDRRLDVPSYQRAYSWEDEQIADYWWDLRAAFGSRASQYFLGTIVLTTDAEGRTTIIDGQQRLATTCLLFTALRNEFRKRSDVDRAQVIERDYVVAVDLRTAELVPRLTLNPDDQPDLQAAIFSRDPPPNRDVDSRLWSALRFFEAHVAAEAKNAGRHWAETLFRWVEFLEHRARVITVQVADEADAFLIFETLNARGRELTVADLLKNYLFGLAQNDLEVLQRDWVTALRALEASAGEEVFTTFVRHLWGSMRGATRERELYGRMKAEITSKKSALVFGRELREAAPHYAALLSADHEYWAEHRAVTPVAETLRRLGLEQNRPLLLAAMRRFEAEEFDRLLRAVICWSVRGLVVGGIGGGTTERAYGEAAVLVTEGAARDADAVYEELIPVIPTDDIFEQSFAQRRINRSRIAKYLLIALTQAEEGSKTALVVPDSLEAEFDLRLVLPRAADASQWERFPADELGQWALRLGNQYVVRRVGNADSRSEGTPAFGAVDPPAWSTKKVAKRQSALAGMAVEIWPRRP